MIRYIKLIVARTPVPIFDESAYSVEIVDDAAGEFVTVRNVCGTGVLDIDPRDWPELRKAIDEMIEESKSDES